MALKALPHPTVFYIQAMGGGADRWVLCAAPGVTKGPFPTLSIALLSRQVLHSRLYAVASTLHRQSTVHELFAFS